MTTVNKLIKQELALAKASESELADYMELAEEDLKQIIDGKRKPSVDESIKLAQFFDLDLMLFVGGK